MHNICGRYHVSARVRAICAVVVIFTADSKTERLGVLTLTYLAVIDIHELSKCHPQIVAAKKHAAKKIVPMASD